MCFPKEDKTFLEAVPAAGGANETEENMKIIKGTAYCVLKQLQKVTSATELLLTGHKAKPNASGSLFLLNMIFMFFRLLLLNHWYKRNNAHWHTINNIIIIFSALLSFLSRSKDLPATPSKWSLPLGLLSQPSPRTKTNLQRPPARTSHLGTSYHIISPRVFSYLLIGFS